MGWECSPHDIILLTRQAARQDCGGFPATRVGQEPPPLCDFQNLTDSIQTESIADTAALRDYREAYESLSAARKMEFLRISGAGPLWEGGGRTSSRSALSGIRYAPTPDLCARLRQACKVSRTFADSHDVDLSRPKRIMSSCGAICSNPDGIWRSIWPI